MRMIKCKQCAFWDQIVPADLGECRAHAPEVVSKLLDLTNVCTGIFEATIFPQTMFDCSCGEAVKK